MQPFRKWLPRSALMGLAKKGKAGTHHLYLWLLWFLGTL